MRLDKQSGPDFEEALYFVGLYPLEEMGLLEMFQ